MRLRRLCLEIFALRRFFKEPIAGVSVRRASEAQPKHRLSEMANAFAAKSRYQCSIGLPAQPARRGGRTLSESPIGELANTDGPLVGRLRSIAPT